MSTYVFKPSKSSITKPTPTKTKLAKTNSTTKPLAAPFISPFISPGAPQIIQPKLKIGEPNDRYEQEADRVADEVMHMPDSGVVGAACAGEEKTLQLKPLQEPPTSPGITGLHSPVTAQFPWPNQTALVQRQGIQEKEEQTLQTKGTNSATPVVTPRIEAGIHALKGGGQPLAVSERSFFEARFGYDLSQVRVHTDAPAVTSAQAMKAKAFTIGHDIAFGAGEYSPGTTSGRRLLAHELTHVMQQRGSKSQIGRVEHRLLAHELSHDNDMYALHRAVQSPPAIIPSEQKQRIIARIEEFVLSSEQSTEDEKTPRDVASYLVISEDLSGDEIAALLAQIQTENPDLMQAVAFGGRLFNALAELGVVGLASTALWYLGITVRDTLAGDFVEDPTALAIVLRTLLTLIPGLDTAADVEDIVANLLYGILDPAEKLVSIGWWFGLILALIGLFPEFGSAIKGAVQLTIKGLGKVARVGLDAIVPRFLTLLDSGWQLLDQAGSAIRELLASADQWQPWVVTSFKKIIDTAIEYLSNLPTTLASKVASVLETLRTMKSMADDMLRQALDELQRFLGEALETLGLRGTDDLPDTKRGMKSPEEAGGRKVSVEINATERALLERTGKISGKLEDADAMAELAIVLRGKKQPLDPAQSDYSYEVDLGNGHSWRQSETGKWCRFSETPTNCDALDKLVAAVRPVLGERVRNTKKARDTFPDTIEHIDAAELAQNPEFVAGLCGQACGFIKDFISSSRADDILPDISELHILHLEDVESAHSFAIAMVRDEPHLVDLTVGQFLTRGELLDMDVLRREDSFMVGVLENLQAKGYVPLNDDVTRAFIDALTEGEKKDATIEWLITRPLSNTLEMVPVIDASGKQVLDKNRKPAFIPKAAHNREEIIPGQD